MVTNPEVNEEAPAPVGASSRLIPCAHCENPVLRHLSAIPASGRVFCNMDCTRAYRKANASKNGIGSVVRACPICNNPFRTSPSVLKIHCSPECYRAGRVGKKRNYPARMRTADRITKPCGHCGKPVERLARDSREFHYCNRSCAAKGQAKRSGRPPLRKIGDRFPASGGYVAVKTGKDHPMATKRGTVLEHRLVMAEVIGRPLLPREQPHHVNGVKTDNSPTNLELWVVSQPKGQRVGDLLAWARELIATYEPIESLL